VTHGKSPFLDIVWARAEAATALYLIEGLITHTTFLERAVEHKARRPASRSFRYDNLLRVQEAERDARSFCAHVLRLMAHLEHAGILDGAFRVWKRRRHKGSMAFEDLWTRVHDEFDLPKFLAETGVPTSLTQWLHDRRGRTIVTFGADELGNPTIGLAEETIEVAMASVRLERSRSLAGLLFAHRLDVMVATPSDANWTIAPIFPARWVEKGKYRITAMDGVVAGGISYLQTLTHHRRQLESTAVTPIFGSVFDPTSLLIGGFLVALIGVSLTIACEDFGKKELCLPGEILLALGLLAVAVGSAATASSLEPETHDWWELRAGDLSAYRYSVQGTL
jgi:hypothetical protein